MSCYNCEKPAMWLVSEKKIPLCLDCYAKFAQIQQTEIESYERMMNYFGDQIALSFGVPPMGPRFPPRPKPIQFGDVSLNNIKVENSVVGSINTGTVGSVDVSITMLKQNGDTQLAEALTKLSEAVLANTVLQAHQKNEALEILSLIANEASAPPNRRRTSALKPLLSRLRDIISTAGDLTTIWQQWGTVVLDSSAANTAVNTDALQARLKA
jgi:hypothetical protein